MILDLAAIKAACEAATPGPWAAAVWIETDGNEWRATGPGHEDQSHDHGSEPGCPDEQAAQADARFISLARQALPECLAEIERLRGLLAEACAFLDDINGDGCAYEDNCPSNARHYVCQPCNASRESARPRSGGQS